ILDRSLTAALRFRMGSHMQNRIRRISRRHGGARLLASLLLVLGLVAVAAPVLAQINPFGKEGGNLTKEDWAELNAAKAKALADPAAVGTQESWANAKSGHSGTIAITKAFTRGGLPCRTVKYGLKGKASSAPKIFTMNECKAPDGSWKYI